MAEPRNCLIWKISFKNADQCPMFSLPSSTGNSLLVLLIEYILFRISVFLRTCLTGSQKESRALGFTLHTLIAATVWGQEPPTLWFQWKITSLIQSKNMFCHGRSNTPFSRIFNTYYHKISVLFRKSPFSLVSFLLQFWNVSKF
jgi:hypothetical protein